METIKLASWEDFEQAIKKLCQERKNELKQEGGQGSFSNLLFRGLSNACYPLETTLERFCKDRSLPFNYSWEDYYEILFKVRPSIHSLTSQRFRLPKFVSPPIKKNRVVPLGYELMVYMRHHGFPSPLLDWTRSPYVAAFFAFQRPVKNSKVAIHTFMELAGEGKTGQPNIPSIWAPGPYIETHPRHYVQQSEYTYCYKQKGNNRIYCPHQDVRFGNQQDILKKYILPSSEREEVLRKLDFMNINAFSLFGSEEGLMGWLAYREVERRKYGDA